MSRPSTAPRGNTAGATTSMAVDGDEENQSAAPVASLLLRRLSELEASTTSVERLRAREASERELEALAKGLPLAALAAGAARGGAAPAAPRPVPGLLRLRGAARGRAARRSAGSASLWLLDSPVLSVPVPPAEWGLVACWREKGKRGGRRRKKEEEGGEEEGDARESGGGRLASSSPAAAAFFAPLGRRGNKRLDVAVPGKGMRSSELDVFLVCGEGERSGGRSGGEGARGGGRESGGRRGGGGGERGERGELLPPPLLFLGTLSPDALSAALDAGEAEEEEEGGGERTRRGALTVRAVVGAPCSPPPPSSSCPRSPPPSLAAALLSSLLAAGSAPPPPAGAGGPALWSRGGGGEEGAGGGGGGSSSAGATFAAAPPGRGRASLRLDAFRPASGSGRPASAAAAVELTLSGDVADLAALHTAVRGRLSALSGSSAPSSSRSASSASPPPPPLPFAAASAAALEASLAALRGLRGAAVALEDEIRALEAETGGSGEGGGGGGGGDGTGGARPPPASSSSSSLRRQRQRLGAARAALADAFVALRGATGAVPAACL